MEKHKKIKIQVAVEWPFHKLSCQGEKKCIKDSFKAGLTAAVKKCMYLQAVNANFFNYSRSILNNL